MAYAKNFKHDVFVSYAHADDQTLRADQEGWVTGLLKGINVFLGQEGLRGHDVWIDQSLAGNVDLAQQLTETLAASATLVVALSPAYLASEWCERERNAFLDLVERRRSSGSAVFVIELDRVDDVRPKAFEGLRGYKFWKEDLGRRRGMRLMPGQDEEEYYLALDDLCHDLALELKRVNSSSQTKVTADERVEHTVFLAEVTDDIDGKRDEVRRFLRQRGVLTLPEAMYPMEVEQFRAAAAADLDRADLFVQLLSAVPGKRGLVRTQYELAAASRKPILQWRPPDLDLSIVDSEEHRSVLAGMTVRAEGLESFKVNVLDFLRRPKKKPAPTSQRGSALVFVNMESEDRALAQQVCDILEEQGVGFSLPLAEGSPSEIRKDLELNLGECDAVIVVYGVTTASWVRGQLLQHRRIIAKRTEGPLKAFAVFQGATEDRMDLNVSLPGLEVVQVGPNDLEAKVADFVRMVEGYDA